MENNKNQVWNNTQDVSLLTNTVSSEDNIGTKAAAKVVLGAIVNDLLS